MAVCANRSDSPGFFTACTAALGASSCLCGDQVAAELIANSTSDLDTQEN